MHAPKHTVILGGGPAGLACGHELSANGGKVTVLERNSYVGGLCRTVESDGFRFDLGGHRWFTKNEDLNDWFRRLMGDEIIRVNRISRIYYGRKYFNYPVQFGEILRKSGPIVILQSGLTYLWAALMKIIDSTPPANMKEAYTEQFGSKLYDMFFRRYSEKLWGSPCEELSADWVSQRSKGLSVWSLIQDVLKINRKKETSLIDSFMYPKNGYMRIPIRMAEDIEKASNEVMLEASVTKLTYHGPNDIEVFYSIQGIEKSIRADAVVSTIPLNLLTKMINPGCDATVQEAAQGLKFRNLITVNLQLTRKSVSSDTWLYIQDEDILFSRIHEPKNWSKAMVPEGENTSLVLECFCSGGDSIWSMNDDEIRDRCVNDLTNKLGFINEDEVKGFTVVRTIQAYPIYDLQYSTKLGLIKTFLEKFEGLHMVGRGGTFRYNNADHSIEMGLLLGQKLLGENIDYDGINMDQEYHEIRSKENPEGSRYRTRQI
ncbi:MAG: FAD-dependent oxidoreductase [Nitrospinales bacterium]